MTDFVPLAPATVAAPVQSAGDSILKESAMTDTIATPVEAAEFFTEYAGVRIIELDEGVYHLAYGHVDFEALRASINTYLAETVGDEQLLGVNAQHAWAVLRHAEGARDDEGWYFTWVDITQDTPHAFPVTVG